MTILNKHAGLYTDHYELTMAQGYFFNNKKNTPASFDYFFRKNPFEGGYVIFAGLTDLLEVLETLRFDVEDCKYLRSIGFAADFVEYLKGFEFRADIYAPEEGEVVFPYEPVVRTEGNIIETQIIETILLNMLNFESLIATKAARIRQAAGDRLVIDFGLRRAQGLGGIHASRAAVIGGANSTSNVYSAFMFSLESTGTQAHSWIQSYEDELTAFRDFAKTFPQRCVFLVDTYDTLRSGIPNAVTVAREMEARGEKLFGIRLDSGDFAYLSKKARKMLDDAGLNYVKIMASNQLDEYLIKSLLDQGAPVDAFGVGTNLITGRKDAALDGVYKLTMSGSRPRLKISENPEKIILPGIKDVFRCIDNKGMFYADCVSLSGEDNIEAIYHPSHPGVTCAVSQYRTELLFRKVMDQGRIVMDRKKPAEIAKYVCARMGQLPEEHKRFENPHIYKVGITKKLMDLRSGIVDEIRRKYCIGGLDHESAFGC
ncbi:MAG TPA: nicotinate phosphoribosyltransferase [Dissulfurispiraceae bacterium]|nr:nicotinate phosphoribosyltransferase [Dissulfurispiraceae bacterium]